jgi:hypothetical protein
MVREDDTASGEKKQKNAVAGPTTLDLNATEVASESPATVAEGPSEAGATAAPVDAGPGEKSKSRPLQPKPLQPKPSKVDSPKADPWQVAPLQSEQPQPATVGTGTAKIDETKAEEIKAEETTAEETKAEKAMASEDKLKEPASDVRPAPKLDSSSAPPPPLPPPRSNMPIVVVALAGGIIGGALVLAAGAFNLVPLGKGGDGGLSARMTTAEQDIASTKTAIDQAVTRAAAAEDMAKTARDAASNAVNLAGDAQKAAAGASGTAPAGPSSDVAGLTERLAKAEAEIAALHQTAGQAAAASTTATQVQSDLQNTQKQLTALESASSAAANKAAAYAVALSQIAEAVGKGRPFAAELKTAASIGGNAEALAPLAAFADTGMPSTEMLASGFDAIKPQLIAAMTPKPAEAPAGSGMMDRLMASLGHIVTITKEGDGSSEDPTVPVQKVADALHNGDLAGAIAAFKAMPDTGQRVGAAWFKQASGVLDTLNLIKAETNTVLQKFSGQ